MAHTFRLNGLEYTILEGAECAGVATETFMCEEAACRLLRTCLQGLHAREVLRAIEAFVGMPDYQVAAILGRRLYQRRLHLQVAKAREKKQPEKDHSRTPRACEESPVICYDGLGYAWTQCPQTGCWSINALMPRKKGSLADGSRPLDPGRPAVPQNKTPTSLAATPTQQQWLEVEYVYADGTPVTGAAVKVLDQSGNPAAKGVIGGNLFKTLIPDATTAVTVHLHNDPLIKDYLQQPYANPELPKTSPGWFDRMAANLRSAGDWAAGTIAGDFPATCATYRPAPSFCSWTGATTTTACGYNWALP